MQKILRELVSIPGPCGFEHEIARYLYNRLKEVADEMGFEDQHYFSRLFTKVTGVTPSAYRKHLLTFDPSKQ